MTSLRFALAGLAVVLLATSACAPWQTSAPVMPSSYERSREQVPRTVGKLRRLAVLTLRQALPKACDGPGDEHGELEAMNLEVNTQLSGAKGYELIEPDPQRYADWMAAPGNEAFVRELIAAAAGKSAPPGPLARALLDRLRADEHADGLMLIRIRMSCQNATLGFRGLMAVGTLGLSEVLPNAELNQPIALYDASVFESLSGRLVWHQADPLIRKVGGALGSWLHDGPPPSDVQRLFKDLEPAVPRLLTR